MSAPRPPKLHMGLVGGGFVGRIHALAAQLDGRATLCAGALSSDPVRARTLAEDFGIPPERAYGSFKEMLEKERALPDKERMDLVTVATPNHLHFPVARAFAEAGFHIFCDKPMTFDLAQAKELAQIVERTQIVFALTHNYSGYSLVRQARALVRAGELGEIQTVRVQYLQGSLRRKKTPEQLRRSAWKIDPARAGASGCFGDIGTHAYHLSRYITGLVPERVSCRLESFEKGPLDDYGSALLHYTNGALGTLTASRISHGRENDLRIEIDGTKGSLSWHQEEPHWLQVRTLGQPHRVITCDRDSLAQAARDSCRLPAGHPEGFLEAFANLYLAAFQDIVALKQGISVTNLDPLYPTVHDGVEGMAFVEACVASSGNHGSWVETQASGRSAE